MPVPQSQGQLVEAIQPVAQERVSDRNAEQLVDASAPQTQEQLVEVVAALPVPQIWEQIDECGRAFPALSVPQRSADVAGALAWLARQPVPAPAEQLAPAPLVLRRR